MKRRDFLKRAGISGAAGATVGAAAFAAQAQTLAGDVHWRMATSGATGEAQLFEGAEAVARRVAELTEGRFLIDVSAADEASGGARMLDALRSGKVETGCVPLDLLVAREPAFALAASLPFGLDHRHQRAWMSTGAGREVIEPVFGDHGLVQLHAGATGAQLGLWSRREIAGADDLRGMKVGAAGVSARVYAALGAQPQRLAGDELLAALEKGELDAAEWISPHDDERRGLHKVARHYYYPGLWQSGPELSVLVNLARWRELPLAHRAALQTACSDAAAETSAQYDTKNPQALRRLLAAGVQLRSLPQPVLQAAEAAANRVYAELGAESAHWKRVHAHWAAFRDEQRLWSRLAQYGFDSFGYTHGAYATKA
jgi:TRAP-type mannitol/chloroaromatic compound transport system substrate-binding protein